MKSKYIAIKQANGEYRLYDRRIEVRDHYRESKLPGMDPKIVSHGESSQYNATGQFIDAPNGEKAEIYELKWHATIGEWYIVSIKGVSFIAQHMATAAGGWQVEGWQDWNNEVEKCCQINHRSATALLNQADKIIKMKAALKMCVGAGVPQDIRNTIERLIEE